MAAAAAAVWRACAPYTESSRGLQGYFRHFGCPSCLMRYIGAGRFRLQPVLLALTRRADNQQDTFRR